MMHQPYYMIMLNSSQFFSFSVSILGEDKTLFTFLNTDEKYQCIIAMIRILSYLHSLELICDQI